MVDVKGYLASIPGRLKFKHGQAITSNVYRALYYAATNEGASIDRLFADVTADDLTPGKETSYGYDVVTDTDSHQRLFRTPVSEVDGYYHLANRICARTMEAGDPLYRCTDCGFDDTCVLCHHCFNPDDHEGHDIRISISRGNSGGLCDCSDPQAFPNLNCLCARDQPPANLDVLEESLEATMAAALEYCLDVLNFSVLALPKVAEYTANNPDSVDQLSFSLPYGDDKRVMPYVLVLWNDERHNYPEAQAAIQVATGKSSGDCLKIADQINQEGRAILRTATSVSELIPYRENISNTESRVKTPLVATIMSARDYMREDIVVAVFNWIWHIIGNPVIGVMASRTLAKILLKHDHKLNTVFSSELARELSNDDHGIVVNHGFLPNGKFGKTVKAKSVLQYLLTFECRLTKKVRAIFPTLITANLIAEPQFKREFATQAAEVFPDVFQISALTEREENLGILPEIAVQLWTCPETMQYLAREGLFINLLHPMVNLITAESSEMNPYTHTKVFASFKDRDNKQNSWSLASAVVRHMTTLAMSTSPEMLANTPLCSSPQTFDAVVSYIGLFQGFLRVKRKLGDHVEWDMFQFDDFYSIAQWVLKFAQHAAHNIREFGGGDLGELFERLEVGKLYDSAVKDSRLVSTSEVNLINGLQCFAGQLLSNQPVFHSVNADVAFLSLQSVVFGEQSRIGLWVRNGMSVSKQTMGYFSMLLDGQPYFQDLYICQLKSMSGDRAESFNFFLRGWEMLGWFRGDQSVAQTVYNDRFPTAIAAMVTFFYQLFADRTKLSKIVPQNSLQLALAFLLVNGPLAFSSIKKKLSHIVQVAEIVGALSEVAEYVPPVGLVESGKYKIRDSWLSRLDPMSKYAQTGQFDVISLKQLEISGNSIIEPQIKSTGDESVDKKLSVYFNSYNMVKLVYKLLKWAVENQNEAYMAQLLHYVHAVISEGLADAWVDIPVVHLLVNIVKEGTMSKAIISKARHLIFIMSSDPSVLDSLVDTFGADYLGDLTIRSATATPSEETEAEQRKRKAEQRKAKLMKKFARQQEAFLSQNKTLVEENDQLSDGTLYSCVQCNEDIMTTEKFGVMVNGFRLHTSRGVPPLPNSNLFNNNPSHDLPGTQVGDREDTVAVTCGHRLHYRCYKEAIFDGVVKCPMCRTVHSGILPSFYQKTVPSEEKLHVGNITGVKVFDDNIDGKMWEKKELNEILEHLVAPWVELPTVLANTVRMYEISSRGGKSLWDYPASSKIAVRSLMQCQSQISRGDAAAFIQATEVKSFFDLAVTTFFVTREPWHSVVNYVAKLLLVLGLLDFFLSTSPDDWQVPPEAELFNGSDFLESHKEEDFPKHDVYTAKDFSYHKAWAHVSLQVLYSQDDSDNEGEDLYDSHQRFSKYGFWYMKPFYDSFIRQCALFYDYLTMEESSEGHFESSIDHSSDDIDTLLALLDMPNFEKFVTLLGDDERCYLQTRVFQLKSLALEWPGVVAPIKLPKSHISAVKKVGNVGLQYLGQKMCCLSCGEAASDMNSRHLDRCGRGLVVGFIPSNNTIVVNSMFNDEMYVAHIPGPYVTEHGEIMSSDRSEKAELCEPRYDLLKSMYMTHQLEGYLSRNELWYPLRRFRPEYRRGAMSDDEDDNDDDMPQQLNIPRAWPIVDDDDDGDDEDGDGDDEGWEDDVPEDEEVYELNGDDEVSQALLRQLLVRGLREGGEETDEATENNLHPEDTQVTRGQLEQLLRELRAQRADELGIDRAVYEQVIENMNNPDSGGEDMGPFASDYEEGFFDYY